MKSLKNSEDADFGGPCPACGNDDAGTLMWERSESGVDLLVCLVCGARYDLVTGELQEPV